MSIDDRAQCWVVHIMPCVLAPVEPQPPWPNSGVDVFVLSDLALSLRRSRFCRLILADGQGKYLGCVGRAIQGLFDGLGVPYLGSPLEVNRIGPLILTMVKQFVGNNDVASTYRIASRDYSEQLGPADTSHVRFLVPG